MSDHPSSVVGDTFWSDAIREWQARVDALTRQLQHVTSGRDSLEGVVIFKTAERDKALRDKATLEDVWTRQQQDDVEEINDLMAQVDGLRALLREVEWAGDVGQHDTQPVCPLCGGDKDGPSKGHAPDCRLAAALK